MNSKLSNRSRPRPGLASSGPRPGSCHRLTAHELVRAIADVPRLMRDAVIAVDVLGLSYREAARALRTREATITSRLHRGRQRIARQLLDDPLSDS